MMAKFKDDSEAGKYGLTLEDEGQVIAEETRDGVSYMCVLFDGIEINGVPSVVFELA